MKSKIFALFVGAAAIAGCAGQSFNEVAVGQCPPVAPLATADGLSSGGVQARIGSVSLVCYVDGQNDDLLAEVSLSGTVSQSGIELPFFVAALDEKGSIINRTQMKVTPSAETFSYKLPKINYGRKGSENVKARLVVGFVLTPQQLAENRAAYAKSIGITR